MVDIFANFFGARWLGHGRRTETMLATVNFVYAALLMCSHQQQQSQAIRDLGITWGLVLVFLVIAALMFCGVVGNIVGWRRSWLFRFAGAWLCCAINIWYALRFFTLDITAAYGVAYAIVAIPFTACVMVMAVANRPTPGAPGQL